MRTSPHFWNSSKSVTGSSVLGGSDVIATETEEVVDLIVG
jgi:hypothetical protein